MSGAVMSHAVYKIYKPLTYQNKHNLSLFLILTKNSPKRVFLNISLQLDQITRLMMVYKAIDAVLSAEYPVESDGIEHSLRGASDVLEDGIVGEAGFVSCGYYGALGGDVAVGVGGGFEEEEAFGLGVGVRYARSYCCFMVVCLGR